MEEEIEKACAFFLIRCMFLLTQIHFCLHITIFYLFPLIFFLFQYSALFILNHNPKFSSTATNCKKRKEIIMNRI